MLLRKIYCKEFRSSIKQYFVAFRKTVNCAAVCCHNSKRKNKDKTLFSLLKGTAVATVWVAKLNREKDNLPGKV